MATTKQILNACDKIMKNKIASMLTNFYVSVGRGDDKDFTKRFNRNLELYTKKIFQIIATLQYKVDPLK